MTSALDLQCRFVCQSQLKKIWDDAYGLSEEDVGCTAHIAVKIFLDNTDEPAADCLDRAMTIAFEERDKLYQERMFA